MILSFKTENKTKTQNVRLKQRRRLWKSINFASIAKGKSWKMHPNNFRFQFAQFKASQIKGFAVFAEKFQKTSNMAAGVCY